MPNKPQMLGKYEIIREIGSGGFATVYEATDTTLGRAIALKILNPMRVTDPQFVSRFRSEARITSQLFHPNIVVVFDTGEIEGRFFIATQFVRGKSLNEAVKDLNGQLMPFDQIVSILKEIGAALDYAHENRAIHRDVKPGNILLDEKGKAYLSDFGIARVMGETTALSVSGQVVGTPHYFSPEQADGKPLDGRTDVYSLAVVAYELCTGRVPFQSETLSALIHKIVYEPVPAPEQVSARAIEPIAGALMKGLAKNVDERYPTASAFAAAFAEAVATVRNQTLNKLLTEAEYLMDKGDFANATAKAQEVLKVEPNHHEAQKTIELIKTRYIDTCVQNGTQALQAHHFDGAIKAAQAALKIQGDHPSALALLKDAENRKNWHAQYDELTQKLNGLREEAKQLKSVSSDQTDDKETLKALIPSTDQSTLNAKSLSSPQKNMGKNAPSHSSAYKISLIVLFAIGLVILVIGGAGASQHFFVSSENFLAIQSSIGAAFGAGLCAAAVAIYILSHIRKS